MGISAAMKDGADAGEGIGEGELEENGEEGGRPEEATADRPVASGVDKVESVTSAEAMDPTGA